MQRRTSLFALSYLLCLCMNYGQTAALDLNISSPENIKKFTPIISEPIFLNDGRKIQFTWQEIEMPADCGIEYGFNLYRLDKRYLSEMRLLDFPPEFSTIVKDPYLFYGDEFPQLINGKKYAVIINTHLLCGNRSEKIDGTPNVFYFDYIPKCTAPEKIKISSIGADNFEVQWSGPDASPEGINYLFRYKAMGKDGQWSEILITNGNSVELDDLDNFQRYEVAVKKICPSVKEEPELHSRWIGKENISLPSPKSISLPSFICGETYTYQQCQAPYMSSTEVLSQDTLYIGGFPILIENLVLGAGHDVVYGTGWVPLPFGKQVVKVRIGSPSMDLFVSTNGEICSGVVEGISDDPTYFPDLNPPPIPFGGEICVEPPSAPGFDENGIHNVTGLHWDENGFGSDSLYAMQPPYPGYQSGDLIDTTGQYDPWGFDVNGNHYETGNSTNEFGCTQEQMQEVPQIPPCVGEPYEWLGDSTGVVPTQQGNELANEVEDSLEIWLNLILTDLEFEMDDSISLKGQECGNIRSDMNSLVTGLGYDRKYIFGANDEYFNEGMYKKFTSKPEPLVVEINREAAQVDLEANHIDLYGCDKALQVFKDLKTIYTDLKANGLNDLANELKELIKRFDAENAAKYSDRDSLYTWLTQQVIETGNQVYEDEFEFGYFELNQTNNPGNLAALNYWKEKRIAKGSIQNNGIGNILAVNESELSQALLESFDLTQEDIVFQYKQGWQEINGINRAYFLEAIDNARNRSFLFPSMLTENDSTLMPIVVKNRANDGRLYKVYLDNIVFTPTSASLDAFIVLEFPHNGQKVVFQSTGISFTPKGPQLAPLRLQLGNDVSMRLSNAAKLTLLASSGTFVAINCDGFAGIGVEGDVEICRDKVVPLDETTLAVLPDPERVNANFQIFMPSWGDLFIQLSIDPFAINGLEDIKWEVDSVTLDFSDIKSPGGTPPQGYQSALAGPTGFEKAWKGFYMANLSVTLPNEWSTSGSQSTIAAQDIVIDNMGFSGHVSATNVLHLDDGSAGGWAFSIDQFELTVIANNLEDVLLEGLVHVPIISNANACSTGAPTADDCFPYAAYIETGGNIHFDITMPQNGFCVDMWQAGTVNIDNCSSIEMKLVNGDFDIVAKLSGSIIVNSDLGNGISFNVPEISFQNVEVGNRDPYFSPGTWDFPNDLGVDFGGFAISINDLNMVQVDSGYPALSFGATIELSTKVDLAASGGFLIIGEMIQVNGRQRWKLKDVDVKSICLEGSFPGVKSINGCINFYENNPTYGSGFRGAVGVEFEKIDGYVQAVAQFGKMPTYKYFFVDALYCGTVQIGPLQLKGLGGGVYHHMTRPPGGAGLPVCTGNPTVSNTLGESLSGIIYTPSDAAGLGFKLTVAMALGNDRAFNANATFEVLFNDSDSEEGSGISDIWLYGNGRMMADMDMTASPTFTTSGPPANNSPLSCNVDLHMDFNEGFFHGNIEVYLNTPALKGSGPNNQLGWAEIHLEPGNWYIKMGKPYYGPGTEDLRMGMKATIPGFGELAQFRAYLQLGMNLDPMPPLPQHIQDLTGLNGSIALTRDGVALSGNGFVFGAELNLGGKNYNFAIFEATMAADLGFDISILDYGSGAFCGNTGQALGVNGWYAMGQIYAGLEVGVDVKVKILGSTKRFNIFDMAVAAALQAQLPNPFYARGGVGAKFSVLGGAVKGECDFQFEIGERCQLQGATSLYENVSVIQMVTPADSAQSVPVDTKPIAFFNFPVEEIVSATDFSGNEVSYNIKVDSANIFYRDWDIPVDLELNLARNEMTLVPRIYLPANDTFNMVVAVHVDSNGVNIHSEQQNIMFTTGAGINYINPSNVAGSYPLNGQYNFYKNQIANGKGYVLLEKGQPDLFFEDEEVDLLVRFKEAETGKCTTVPLEYEFFDNKAVFDIPVGFLQNQSIYKMQLVEIPKSTNGYAIDPCIELPPSGNTYASSESNTKGGTPTQKVLYTAYFRVSEYNSFGEKIDTWIDVADTSSDFSAESEVEPFDRFELRIFGEPEGNEDLLVEVVALVNQTPWFTNSTSAQHYMYNNLLPYEAGITLSRDIEKIGYPPFKVVDMINAGFNGVNARLHTIEVKPTNYTTNTFPVEYDDIGSKMRYRLTEYVEQDDGDIRDHMQSFMLERASDIVAAVQDYCVCGAASMTFEEMYDSYPEAFNQIPVAPSAEYFEYFFNKTFSPPSANNSYPVLVRYRMPGTRDITTERMLLLQWE